MNYHTRKPWTAKQVGNSCSVDPLTNKASRGTHQSHGQRTCETTNQSGSRLPHRLPDCKKHAVPNEKSSRRNARCAWPVPELASTNERQPKIPLIAHAI